jgi:hypothetical protein
MTSLLLLSLVGTQVLGDPSEVAEFLKLLKDGELLN